MWFDILKNYNYEWFGLVNARPIMLVDVEGEKVLFYIRTGSGGADNEGVSEENEIKDGQFAPFYGFRHDGWFIKPDGSRAGKYLKVARWLDDNATKDWPRKELDPFEFNREMKLRGAILTNGKIQAQIDPIYIIMNNIREVRGMLKHAIQAINGVRIHTFHPKEVKRLVAILERISRKGKGLDIDGVRTTEDKLQGYYSIHKQKNYATYLKTENKVNELVSEFKDLLKIVKEDYELDVTFEHNLTYR